MWVRTESTRGQRRHTAMDRTSLPMGFAADGMRCRRGRSRGPGQAWFAGSNQLRSSSKSEISSLGTLTLVQSPLLYRRKQPK